jgi:hypothetical protein
MADLNQNKLNFEQLAALLYNSRSTQQVSWRVSLIL